MKISSKGRYALRAMADLALHNTGECIRTKDIAARQNISEKYLEQIVTLLGKGGLIKSIRGAQGGYLLKRAPEDYTIGDILRVAEGDLDPTPDGQAEDSALLALSEKELIYDRLSEAIDSVLDRVTLEDIIKDHRRRLNSFDYVI